MSHGIVIQCASRATCCNGDCSQGRSCENARRLTRDVLLPPPARRPGLWLLLVAAFWSLVANWR